MPHFFSYLLQSGQNLCLLTLPTSPYRDLTAALVCGAHAPPNSSQELILDAGLMHILVVSGAHLHFLDRRLIRAPRFLRWTLLMFYAWWTGFGAPVTRALLRRLCRARTEDWGWSGLQVEALVSLLILIARPDFLFTRSFVLSWLGALALRAPGPHLKWRTLDFTLRAWLFLLPLQPNSFLSVGWNLIFAPVVAHALFPLALASPLVPPLSFVTNGIWRALLFLLAQGPLPGPGPKGWVVGSWALPLVLHSLMLWGEPRWRRASAFLSSSY